MKNSTLLVAYPGIRGNKTLSWCGNRKEKSGRRVFGRGGEGNFRGAQKYLGKKFGRIVRRGA